MKRNSACMPVADKTLEVSKFHLDAIFNYATIGILITDNTGKIIAVNPFVLDEFGFSKKDLIGKKIETLIPERFREKHTLYHKNYPTGPSSRFMGMGIDLTGGKKDGTEFPVEISLSNYSKNGKQFFISFINNISGRKKAQAQIDSLNKKLEAKVARRSRELKRTLNQLQISNETLDEAISFQKAILDYAGALIIATTREGIIKFFNPEASIDTGYLEAEVINKKAPVIFHDKTEIAEKRKLLQAEFGNYIEDDFDVLVEKAKRNIHIEEQYTYIRKDGYSFPVSLTITAIRDNNKEISGFMFIAIDISVRKKTEEELKHSLEKEKELNELKSRFVTMASHEFRSPLSTVLSSAYLLEKYSSSDDQPRREKHLQRIYSSINMLTDILNDFLNVGKIEEGKIQSNSSLFNICELVNGITGEMENNLKKQQTIQYHHNGNPEVMLDKTLMKHIIVNLVSNASKFSHEAKIIEIKTINQGNAITLSVKDHGIGIAKEDQKHLMQRFFRGANAANIQGTGLGLHIVSKYTELMGGSIKCESKLDEGTEFILNFNKIK
jgi:PAS domain S-box-containing protein